MSIKLKHKIHKTIRCTIFESLKSLSGVWNEAAWVSMLSLVVRIGFLRITYNKTQYYYTYYMQCKIPGYERLDTSLWDVVIGRIIQLFYP